MDEQIDRIMDHRENLRIFRDAEDGYYNVDAWNGMPNDWRVRDPESEVVGFGHTLWSALGDLQGNLMESDQRV